MEILKFLSDSNDYKPLNEFIKSISKGESLRAIKSVLREMYQDPRLMDTSEDVVYFKGDFEYIGETFTFLDDKVRPKFKTHVFSMGNPVAGHDKVLGDIMVGDLDNCPFEGRITFRGRKELEDYTLQQSIKSVNDSVTRTNRITLIIAGLAAFFSLMAVLVPILKPSATQVPELKETNSILQKQGQILDSLLQKQNAYPDLIETRKDSLNK